MKWNVIGILSLCISIQANALDFKGVELDKPASEESLHSIGIDTSTCHKTSNGTTLCKGKTTITSIPIENLIVEIAPTGELRQVRAYFGSVFFEMLERVAFEKWGGSKSHKEFPVRYNGISTTAAREEWEFPDNSHITLEKSTYGLVSGLMQIDGPWEHTELMSIAPKDKL